MEVTSTSRTPYVKVLLDFLEFLLRFSLQTSPESVNPLLSSRLPSVTAETFSTRSSAEVVVCNPRNNVKVELFNTILKLFFPVELLGGLLLLLKQVDDGEGDFAPG